MVTDRLIEAGDESLLKEALARDEYHKDTNPEFFVAPGTMCKVYSDESGIILFARGSKALRLDLQFVSNEDKRRNLKAMLGGFSELVNRAKENGFAEVIFNTSNESLKKFCIKAFGFVESAGELRKVI